MSEDRDWRELLAARMAAGYRVCVGLDTVCSRVPERFQNGVPAGTLLNYNLALADATADLAVAFKPNLAFYLRHGATGWRALEQTIQHIKEVAPAVPVILDAKQGDIDTTNDGYVEAAFDVLGADAITINPYLGLEKGLRAFVARPTKGAIVLCRTSNDGATELQNRLVRITDAERVRWGMRWSPGGHLPLIPLYQLVARQVTEDWNKQRNCAVVVGATAPDELREVRAIVGRMPILIPGVGAQGGGLEGAVQLGGYGQGQGVIINLSRSVLYAYEKQRELDPIAAARAEVERVHREAHEFAMVMS